VHAEGSVPVRLIETLRISDALSVHEYRHQDGEEELRTFVTDGLAARGGHEVRATISDDWADPAVEAAVRVLAAQDDFLASGEPASLGAVTGFHDEALARGAQLAVTYARGRPLDGVPQAADALVAVLLHDEEATIAESGLASRVLARLANATRIFPYPEVWEVRERPVIGLAEQAESILAKSGAPRVSMGDTWVTEIGKRIEISLPPRAAEAARALWQRLPELTSLVLCAHLAPDADAQLVWKHGEPGRAANVKGDRRPTRLGHSFFALVPGEELRCLVQEDGSVGILPEERYAEVRRALETGTELELVAGAMTIAFGFRT
jgi:hypothetical protein